MKLIDSYNAYIETYIAERIRVLNPVEWIEHNLLLMGEAIELTEIQRHIVGAENSLVNRHIPRRRGKTFAACCSAIHKSVALKQTCLYVCHNMSSARYAKNTVIEILRASNIPHIHATDYVRIGDVRIDFTTVSHINNHYRGHRVDCIFLDETNATHELEMAMPNTLFVTIGSSALN